jgi:hypothetical protein
MHVVVLQGMTPCSLVGWVPKLQRNACFHLQVGSKDRGNMIFRHVAICLTDYAVSKPAHRNSNL